MSILSPTIMPGIYSFPYAPTSVKKIIDEGIRKLKTIGIVYPYVLDVAIDALEYKVQRQNTGYAPKDNMRNPYRYLMSEHQINKEIQNITSDQIQKIYNEVITSWSDPKSRLTPLDILEQMDAYFSHPKNDSGLENGFVAETFFSNATAHMQYLLINPSPSFLSRIAKDKNLIKLNMAIALSDKRYAEIARRHQWPSNISVQHYASLNLMRTRDRICILGAGVDYDTTASVLEDIVKAVGTKPHTTVFLVAPTAYVDRRKPKHLMRKVINDHCNLLQVLLIDSDAVNIAPEKRALVIFQRGQNTSGTFASSKVKRDGAKIKVSNHQDIPYSNLIENRLTLNGMYDSAKKTNRNNKEPEPVRFSPSIVFWCTIEMPDPKKPNYRARISYYDFPTPKQNSTKKYKRGDCLISRKAGTTVDSKDEVYNCLDDLLLEESTPEEPNILAKTIRATVEKEYGNRPIDLKSLWYLHMEKLLSVDDQGKKLYPQYNHQLCCSLFLGRDWEFNPLCSLIVGSCSQDEIEEAIDVYAELKGKSKTNVSNICKQLKIIFSIYYQRKVGERNPMTDVLEKLSERNERKYKQKQKIGMHSLSMAKTRQFVQSLNSDTENPVKALLAKHKVYLGISNGEAAALTIGDYIHKEAGYSLSVLRITEQMEQIGTATVSYGEKKNAAKKEEARCLITRKYQRRTLSVPTLLDSQLNKMVQKNIKHLKAGGLTDEEINRCPLFPSEDDPRKPIKTRRINEYCLRHLKKLGIQSMEVFDPDDGKDLDLARYSRDLLQANWDHHARADLRLEENFIAYVRGRKPGAIVRSSYCDRDHAHILKEIAVRCDKLPALIELPEDPAAWVPKRIELGPGASSFSHVPMAKDNQLVIEFDVTKTDVVEILANYPHGCSIQVEIIPKD